MFQREARSLLIFLTIAGLQSAIAPMAAAQELRLPDPSLTFGAGIGGGHSHNGTESGGGTFRGELNLDWNDANEELNVDLATASLVESPAFMLVANGTYHLRMDAPGTLSIIRYEYGVTASGSAAFGTDSIVPGIPQQIVVATGGPYLRGSIDLHPDNMAIFTTLEVNGGLAAGGRSAADGSGDGIFGLHIGLSASAEASLGSRVFGGSHEVVERIRFRSDAIADLAGRDAFLYRIGGEALICASPNHVGDVGACFGFEGSAIGSDDGAHSAFVGAVLEMLFNGGGERTDPPIHHTDDDADASDESRAVASEEPVVAAPAEEVPNDNDSAVALGDPAL